MDKKTKQKYKKRIFSIAKLIIMVAFLGWAIETGNKKWYFLAIMIYVIIKKKELYKSTIMSYVYALKIAWNKEKTPPKDSKSQMEGETGDFLCRDENKKNKKTS